VRAHLVNRAAAQESEDEAGDDEDNGGAVGVVGNAVADLPDAEAVAILNEGHRTE